MLGTELRGKQLGHRRPRPHRPRGRRQGAGVRHDARCSRHDAATGERMSLDELLVTSDVVSLHTPLTPETRHLIDRAALARMKRSAFLSTRRAARSSTRRRWSGRSSEHLIAGAALDVYEQEPDVHPELLSARERRCSCRTSAARRARRAPRWPISPSATSSPCSTATAAADAGTKLTPQPRRCRASRRRGGDAPPRAGDRRPRGAGRREDREGAAGGSVPGPDRDAAVGADARTR